MRDVIKKNYLDSEMVPIIYVEGVALHLTPEFFSNGKVYWQKSLQKLLQIVFLEGKMMWLHT